MSATVVAHQLHSEHEHAVTRTPQEYADHVREMLDEYGRFDFEVTSVVAQHDHVAVTWRQTSGPDACARTVDDAALIELAACTYRVHDGEIVEYWLLLDRHGIRQQRQPPPDSAHPRRTRPTMLGRSSAVGGSTSAATRANARLSVESCAAAACSRVT